LAGSTNHPIIDRMICVPKIYEDKKLARIAGPALLCLVALLLLGRRNFFPGGAARQSAARISTVGQFRQKFGAGGGSVIIRQAVFNPRAARRCREANHSAALHRIFTLVRDGGESILTVATRVPYNQVISIATTPPARVTRSRVVFNDVGTSLKVSATILPDNQVQLRLTAAHQLLSSERSGAIDFAEEQTELIVPTASPFPWRLRCQIA